MENLFYIVIILLLVIIILILLYLVKIKIKPNDLSRRLELVETKQDDNHKKLINMLNEQYTDVLTRINSLTKEEAKQIDDTEYYEKAKEIVMKAGKASATLLQRKLRTGYAQSARLLDYLEEQGIVGPYEGSKPREVIKK
jgi:DNA segregation ATPase FtsK/SpoIIIE-like protein